MKHFGEVLTAMVTPFDQELKVDLSKARELARYLIANGSDGLVVLGTTGEVPTLSTTEKLSLLETIVDEVGDQTTVIAGTGSYSTDASLELSKKAASIGVDGVMLVVPYYNKPPQGGLYQHFKKIATGIDLPILLYNVPGRTARNLEVNTLIKLAEIDNIIAVKEASLDMAQISTLTRVLPEDFYVYSGEDTFTLPILAVGGQGVVSVAAHLVGVEIKRMIQAFKAGKVEEAIALNKQLGPIFEAIFITTNPIPVKAALNMVGINVGSLRPPLLNLMPDEEEVLKGIITDYGLV